MVRYIFFNAKLRELLTLCLSVSQTLVTRNTAELLRCLNFNLHSECHDGFTDPCSYFDHSPKL